MITGIAGGSSSNGKMAGGSVYVGKTEDVIIDCGFRPSIIYVNASPDNNDYYVAWFYDESSSQKKR